MSSARQTTKPFKPPRPSTSTAATRTPRRSSLSFSSGPESPELTTQAAPAVTENTEPLIPKQLLTKLLQHHFTDPSTKIGTDAKELVGRYMEIFVREALARAMAEKQEGLEKGEGYGAGGRGGGGVGGDFLEVEDLEKVAAQLLLDF